MIAKVVILLALVAAPALSSSVKGYADTKGLGRVEQLPAKAPEEPKQLAIEGQQVNERLETVELTTGQQREEQVQRVEEAKAPITQTRYEARPQVVREEQTQRFEGVKAPVTQVQVQRIGETKAPIAQVRYDAKPQAPIEELKATEQQRDIQEPIEAGKWTAEEQRRLVEDQPALVQPIAPLTVLEEAHRDQFTQQQVEITGTKGWTAGQAVVQAPFVEAEPYAFSYQVDGSSRSESGDSRGVVRGQYTLQGADGASRIVDYIADANGFRATVNTNEFGTESRSPANTVVRSSQPLAEDISLRLEGKTREDLLPPQATGKTAPVPPKPDNWAVKTPALPLPAPVPQAAILVEEIKVPKKAAELATKRSERLEQPATQQELKEIPVKAPEQLPSSAKSAELRAPKELKTPPALQRDYTRVSSVGFESATAHRTYQSQPVYAPAPAVTLRQQAKLQAAPVAPALRAPRPVTVTRAHLQRDRYPPRRAYDQAGNPRVSFYTPHSSSSSFDDDLTYDQPDV